MNRYVIHHLILALCSLGISTAACASAFQIWEQDAASIGNFHAGYAAEANDASVAWYNPAGIPRIQHQQAVFGASAIKTNIKYRGNVGITENSITLIPVPDIAPVTVTFDSVSAQGGTFALVPNLQYVAPINDWIGFGFSVDIPFGMKTNYGRTSALQYASMLTDIKVIDISPSLGMKISDNAYLGIGFDIQRGYVEFENVATLIDPDPFADPRSILTSMDTTSKFKANDTGYGFRLGYLYEFNPCMRAGISYHSQVVHHFSGSSRLEGPLANLVNGSSIIASRSTTNIKLPPYTAFSFFNKISPTWALMGTFIYTQWNTFKLLSLNQVAGVVEGEPLIVSTTNLSVNIPQNYRNTWNLSVGGNYYYSDTIILRGGVGYDQTPVRTIQLPDNDRVGIALGAHYQATKTIGVDAGWTHVLFVRQANVNPPSQTFGAESVTVNGHVKAYADVVGVQMVWDIL